MSKFLAIKQEEPDSRLPTAYFAKEEDLMSGRGGAVMVAPPPFQPRGEEVLREANEVLRKSIRISSSKKSKSGKVNSAPPKRQCHINIEDSSKFISVQEENLLMQPPPPPLTLKTRRFKRPLMAKNVFKDEHRHRSFLGSQASSEPPSLMLQGSAI